MRIVIVDTYYPDFLKSVPFDARSTYEVELRKILDRQFGTADFYSQHLRSRGWDAVDIIANHENLQLMWMRMHGYGRTAAPASIIADQIYHCDPDILFFQDISLLKDSRINFHIGHKIIAAQCSCAWPGDGLIGRMDIVFTSFPHYVPRIEKLGVRAVYNPLAFEPSVLIERCSNCGLLVYERACGPTHAILTHEAVTKERIHDCVFIGGVGNPSHWKRGMETLETVAREIPTFKWWGYGMESLPRMSALRAKYQGLAWGREMYEILLRSKICLNRHGEVAEGFGNNMRMYEATGCGALLITDNQTDLFADDEIVRYSTPRDAVDKIRYYLAHEQERAAIAVKGQQRTLTDPTYAKRMKKVSDVLQEMLCPA